MKKTIVKVRKMDCPSEIKMIEGLVEQIDASIKVEFDLTSRTVVFYHQIDADTIIEALESASLPGETLSSEVIDEADIPQVAPSVEAKTLKYLLVINFTMFVVETSTGIYADSTGLIADGLDMLADSLVYGVSLYAVGKTLSVKNKTAYLSGIMQISLGLICLLEVARKLFLGSEPLSSFMIMFSIVALVANVWCLALIYKHRDGEVHMKASWIFSANDVIVNTGVIISGFLVYTFNSNIPDLIIGAFVSVIVVRGGYTIIKLSKSQKKVAKKKTPC